MAVAIAKAPTMSLAAVRPATPRPSSCTSQQLQEDDPSTSWFDKQLRKTSSSSSVPEKQSKKMEKVKKTKTSRVIFGRASSELSPEAEQLKAQIRRKWPVSLFKFKFRLMKRVVVAPVPIPQELAHSRAWAAMVSGIRIPLTRMMWLRQRRKLLYRLPDTIREDVGY